MELNPNAMKMNLDKLQYLLHVHLSYITSYFQDTERNL